MDKNEKCKDNQLKKVRRKKMTDIAKLTLVIFFMLVFIAWLFTTSPVVAIKL